MRNRGIQYIYLKNQNVINYNTHFMFKLRTNPRRKRLKQKSSNFNVALYLK